MPHGTSSGAWCLVLTSISTLCVCALNSPFRYRKPSFTTLEARHSSAAGQVQGGYLERSRLRAGRRRHLATQLSPLDTVSSDLAPDGAEALVKLIGFDEVADGARHGDPAHGAAEPVVKGAHLGEEVLAQEPHLAAAERIVSTRALHTWPRRVFAKAKFPSTPRKAPKAAAAALRRLLTPGSEVRG